MELKKGRAYGLRADQEKAIGSLPRSLEWEEIPPLLGREEQDVAMSDPGSWLMVPGAVLRTQQTTSGPVSLLEWQRENISSPLPWRDLGRSEMDLPSSAEEADSIVSEQNSDQWRSHVATAIQETGAFFSGGMKTALMVAVPALILVLALKLRK